MKRFSVFLMVIVLLMALCSISIAENDYSFINDLSKEELIELGKKIDTRIKELEKSESSPDDYGMWSLRYYVDEFSLPTDEAYITNTDWTTGVFSNSATTRSKLNVSFLIDKDDVAIELYEYGSSQVKNTWSKNYLHYYDVVVMGADKVRHKLEGYYFEDGDRMFFSEEDEKVILDLMKQDAEIYFSIVDQEREVNKYSFSIENCSYFSRAYDALMKK